VCLARSSFLKVSCSYTAVSASSDSDPWRGPPWQGNGRGFAFNLLEGSRVRMCMAMPSSLCNGGRLRVSKRGGLEPISLESIYSGLIFRCQYVVVAVGMTSRLQSRISESNPVLRLQTTTPAHEFEGQLNRARIDPVRTRYSLFPVAVLASCPFPFQLWLLT
jgi:hypothetical protein